MQQHGMYFLINAISLGKINEINVFSVLLFITAYLLLQSGKITITWVCALMKILF